MAGLGRWNKLPRFRTLERRNKKQWHKTAYIKQAGSADQEWIVLPNTLPHPLAYGASIQIKQGILCIGGCGDRQCYSDVFLLKVQNGSVEIDKNWPSLPVPLANMTSSLLDNKIFVAGGQESVDAPIASKHFFMLDLSDKGRLEVSSSLAGSSTWLCSQRSPK